MKNITSKEIVSQLELIASADDFVFQTYKLTDEWASFNVEKEVIEPVLVFIENHPLIDYGTPGPLIHFLESFYSKNKDDYKQNIIKSIERKPTRVTLEMLKRLINGTGEINAKNNLTSIMEKAKNSLL